MIKRLLFYGSLHEGHNTVFPVLVINLTANSRIHDPVADVESFPVFLPFSVTLKLTVGRGKDKLLFEEEEEMYQQT